MPIQSHRELKVWQDSVRLALDIHKLTESFPKHELYGIVSQMRRASTSIPANIAEGSGRHHTREFIQSLGIAQGSLRELDTYIFMAEAMGHLKAGNIPVERLDEIGKMISGLVSSLRRRL